MKRRTSASPKAAPVSKSPAVSAPAPSNPLIAACGIHKSAAKGNVVPPLRERIREKSSGSPLQADIYVDDGTNSQTPPTDVHIGTHAKGLTGIDAFIMW